MNNLKTIDDSALEAVSGGGIGSDIGSSIGGLLDSALTTANDLLSGGFGLFGDLLSGLGDFISKIGQKL